MNYQNIGETDLYASVLCFGGATVTPENDLDYCFQLLDLYERLGGNVIDTANVYGKWLPKGENTSEQNIGKWMKERGNRREIILATKGGHPDLDSMNKPRLKREEIEHDLQESLQGLQTSYIDLYWLHRDDENLPVSYVIDYLNDFVNQGKIRYFGCSNWRAERIYKAKEYAETHGLQGFTANQMMWSLAKPNKKAMEAPLLVPMDEEMKQLHMETDLAAVPFSSQAKGFFEKLAKNGERMADGEVRNLYYNEENVQRLVRLQKLSNELSLSLTELSLSYLLSQPFQTFPVIGSRTIDQMTSSMRAGDLTLSEEQVKFLEGNG